MADAADVVGNLGIARQFLHITADGLPTVREQAGVGQGGLQVGGQLGVIEPGGQLAGVAAGPLGIDTGGIEIVEDGCGPGHGGIELGHRLARIAHKQLPIPCQLLRFEGRVFEGLGG